MTENQIPSKLECLAILAKNKTPSNVIEHCKAVCKVAEGIADKLINKGIKLNKNLVIAAALLHDVEREKENHIIKGTRLIKGMGFSKVAEVISKHGLFTIEYIDTQPATVEEKIVFYADKRVNGNKTVSLKERAEDLERRYNKRFDKEFEFAKRIEKELMQ